MSSQKRPTSEFWEEASAALAEAPHLRAASRDLRSSSTLLRVRNLQANLIAADLAAKVFELSIRIERSGDYVAATGSEPFSHAPREIPVPDGITNTEQTIA